ncbi:MAG: winged helix-turn-helix transcriptional regulator [Lachnospiraceae bacterium]
MEYSQIPPKVEYSLTNIGKKFEKVLDALGEWGEEYIDYLNQKNC